MGYLDDINRIAEQLKLQQNGKALVELTAFQGRLSKVESTTKTVIKINDVDQLLRVLERVLSQAQKIEYDGTMNLAITFKRGKLKELAETNEERKIYE